MALASRDGGLAVAKERTCAFGTVTSWAKQPVDRVRKMSGVHEITIPGFLTNDRLIYNVSIGQSPFGVRDVAGLSPQPSGRAPCDLGEVIYEPEDRATQSGIADRFAEPEGVHKPVGIGGHILPDERPPVGSSTSEPAGAGLVAEMPRNFLASEKRRSWSLQMAWGQNC
jgi:hypothetical protein